MSVKFISLGCPKNLVDSEVMVGVLAQNNFEIKKPDEASDIGVVNTCGFIDASKQESIDTILGLAEEKKKGNLKYIVVAGCLSQRYAKELPKLLHEVDAFIGTGDFSRLPEIIRKKAAGDKKRNYVLDPSEQISSNMPRALSTPSFSRYVKISEGCSHACSFCIIPTMRGGLKSRTINDIEVEMRQGIDAGVKEFVLVGQDLNEYGRDLSDRQSLFGLLKNFENLSGDFWIRLMYLYPLQFPDRLIQLIKDHPHVIPYVDIPLQHISDKVLKSMKRGSSAKYIHRLVGNLRKFIPDIVIRTTFIAGYPGETEKDFGQLVEFVREYEFDRLGVFTYSEEEGTSAANLKKQLPQNVRDERRDFLMQTQQAISRKRNSQWVGKTVDVLYEGHQNPEILVEPFIPHTGFGRFYGQAPEIDGQVLITNKQVKVGDFAQVKITQALDYDLVGEVVSVRENLSPKNLVVSQNVSWAV